MRTNHPVSSSDDVWAIVCMNRQHKNTILSARHLLEYVCRSILFLRYMPQRPPNGGNSTLSLTVSVKMVCGSQMKPLKKLQILNRKILEITNFILRFLEIYLSVVVRNRR